MYEKKYTIGKMEIKETVYQKSNLHAIGGNWHIAKRQKATYSDKIIAKAISKLAGLLKIDIKKLLFKLKPREKRSIGISQNAHIC